MVKRILSYLFLLIIPLLNTYGADPVFSQYFLNPLHLNPAVAGAANDPRIFMHYRNHWPAFGNTFITYQASYDQFFKSSNSGFGLNVLRDEVYDFLTNTNIDFSYSHRIKANQNWSLQGGLSLSFVFQGVDASKFKNLTDPPAAQMNTQPDFAAGFLAMSRQSQIGFSASHLNTGYLRFNSYFEASPLKFIGYFSHTFKIYDKTKVKDNGFYVTPAFMVQYQSPSIMVNYGVSVRVENVIAGVWARTNPASFSSAIFSLGYAFDRFAIGYSYDYNMLSAQKYMPNTGSHEVTLVATFPLDPKRGRYGPVKSPFDLYGRPAE